MFWRHSFLYASLKGHLSEICRSRKRYNIAFYSTNRVFSYIRDRKRRITLSGRVPYTREVRQRYLSNMQQWWGWRYLGWRATAFAAASDIVIEIERKRNSLVHLWARYWVRVASGLSPKNWIKRTDILKKKNYFLKFWWFLVFTTLLIIALLVFNKHCYSLIQMSFCYNINIYLSRITKSLSKKVFDA